MIKFIKRAFDAVRLTKELEVAEKRIEELHAEIGSRLLNPGPAFREVAKDFDVSHITDQVYDRVINDFSKFLEPEMVRLLKTVATGMKQDHRYSMNASVAVDLYSGYHEFIFEVPQMGTVVKSYGY